MYNVNIDTLISLNPSAKIGIKTGEILIISKDKKIEIETVTPKTIKEAVSKAEAEEIKAKLEAEGAAVELK